MRRRIAICLGLLLAMVALGDAAAVIALSKSIRELSTLVNSHRIQNLREHLAMAGQRVRADSMAILAGRTVGDAARKDAQAELRAAVARCGACHHEAPIKAELDELGAMVALYLSQLNQRRTPAPARPAGGDVTEVTELGERLVDRIAATADRASRHLTVRSERVMQSVSQARTLLFVALALALVIGLAGALYLQRCLTRPINGLIEGIRRMRGGRREFRLALHGDSEFQEIAHAFNDAYEDLQSSQRAVVHAERMAAVGQLAAGVAHEVLNPMASISSVVQILRSTSDDPDYIHKVNLIMKEIDRVTKIVRDINAFTRPTGKEASIDVDLHAALDHAINLVRYDKRAKNVAITCVLAEGAIVIRGHVDRLLIVLTNILFNALDAVNGASTARGEITIRTSKEGGHAVVSVRDNGPGMTDEQIARAFEPFFTTKPPGAGTGLGLWTSHRIVEALGGTITMESPEGGGTCVTLRFPTDGHKPSAKPETPAPTLARQS